MNSLKRSICGRKTPKYPRQPERWQGGAYSGKMEEKANPRDSYTLDKAGTGDWQWWEATAERRAWWGICSGCYQGPCLGSWSWCIWVCVDACDLNTKARKGQMDVHSLGYKRIPCVYECSTAVGNRGLVCMSGLYWYLRPWAYLGPCCCWEPCLGPWSYGSQVLGYVLGPCYHQKLCRYPWYGLLPDLLYWAGPAPHWPPHIGEVPPHPPLLGGTVVLTLMVDVHEWVSQPQWHESWPHLQSAV